ncbi:class I SAM-dependent methyltransferase [Proteinivorax tanatarense]|uniref:Class I SAM-dependent methyltransferase n=1 Tax=Proteinivorax tanatarense TaxID=1260629 RepID=A0AAU7VQ20_9FIRM
MKFYKEIAIHYDDIFPVKSSVIEFIANRTPPKGNVLDVGCATGSHGIELSKLGYQVKGVDISKEMIEIAKDKSVGLSNISFATQDIFALDEESCYDTIICIGNTLPHFTSLEEIKDVLTKFKKMLKHGGKVIVQTVNYDRVLKQKTDSLPTITNKNLKFIREYSFNGGLIDFNTILKVGRGNFKNSVKLYPLTSKNIEELLAKLKYSTLEFYGGFDESNFNIASFHMVLDCTL